MISSSYTVKKTYLEEKVAVDKPPAISKTYQLHDFWELLKEEERSANLDR